MAYHRAYSLFRLQQKKCYPVETRLTASVAESSDKLKTSFYSCKGIFLQYFIFMGRVFMKLKFSAVMFHLAAAAAVISLIFCFNISPARADDDTGSIAPELLLEQEEEAEESHQRENILFHAAATQPKKSYLEIDFFSKTYMPADGSTTYTSTPFLFRTNILKHTDWWIGSDLLTKQYPNCGINDIVSGLKWHFKQGEPDIALIAGAQFNTAGGNVGDHAFEPQAGIALDYDINRKWQISANVLYKYLWDSTARQRYNQYNYANENYYTFNDKQRASFGFIANCPNASPVIPKGVNVTKAFAGYFFSPNKNLHYSIHVTKGLSFVDINWSVLAGVGMSL